MKITGHLITQVLDAAKAKGLGQADVAERAHIAPETISRAKKRESIELTTLAAMSQAVGLKVALVPTDVDISSFALNVAAPIHHLQGNTSSLAHPSRGLAWSNRMVSNEVLCKNALTRRSYDLILEAVLEYGERFVRKQWADLLSDPSVNISDAGKATVERQLRNIHTGICNAAAKHRTGLEYPADPKVSCSE